MGSCSGVVLPTLSRRWLTHWVSALLFMFGATAPRATLGAEKLRTSGNEVVALRPDGAGWTCDASSHAGDGFTLAEIRCSRALVRGALRLYAKDYEGPSETVDGICARDWKSYYRSVLPNVSRLNVKTVREDSLPVCVVDAEGTSTTGERLRIKEWYVVAPRHVLLITAAGPDNAMASHEQAITQWRNGVTFRAAPNK